MGFGVLAACGSLLLATLVLELWNADFSVPWSYSKDGLFNLMIVKSTIEHGWFLHNSSLGYPFGQDLHDFPVVEGDIVHLLLIKLIGLFTSNPALVANVFFLITFPLTAAIAYWVLRRLGITPPVACACATLYALAPYHFLRGELHLFLQGYFAVPAGVWLALMVALDEPLLERRLRSRTTLTTLAVCLLVATSEVYYAAFTIMLVGVMTVFVLLRGRTGAAIGGAVAIAAIGGVLFVEHLPTLVYHVQHGANTEVGRLRSPYDSQVYGLRPVRLMLPMENHRLHPLAELTQRYENNSSNDQLVEGPTQAIGLVALVGLVWLVLRLLSRAAVRRAPESFADQDPQGPVASAAGVTALVAILIATTSSVSMLIAVYISDSVRSWARMSIVLAFIGVLGAALLLDRLVPRLAAMRRGGRTAVAATLVGIVALGTLDQSTPAIVPPYSALNTVWHQDQAFVRAIEARVPRGSPIFQLPFIPIPEYGWDQARPYLHSDSLRWSWGAMAGRPADWQTPLVGKSPEVEMAAAVATGFKGLYLDLTLYPQPRLPLRDFQRLLGVQPLLLDGRLAYLDLSRYAARLRAQHTPAEIAALRASVLNPVRIVFGPDWGALLASPDVPPSVRRSRWSHKRIVPLQLTNPGSAPRDVTFTAALFSDAPAPGAATEVIWPDGKTERLKVGTAGTQVAHHFTLRPGKTAITFATAAPQTNDETSQKPAFLKLANYTLTDSVEESFAKAGKS